MEELKLLIEMVSHLPTLTVWVLAGYLAYKIAVIGSIYGVIKLMIQRLYEWKTHPAQFKVSTRIIDAQTAEALQVQIARIGSTSYIHMSDVQALREALDVKLNERVK